MAKIYLDSIKGSHGDHDGDETSDEDSKDAQKLPRVVDMYSILHELDQVKAARDEVLAQ